MERGIRLYLGSHEGLSIWRPSSAGWAEVGSGVRGVIEALDGSRQHPERVYAGAAQDGLYRTEDAGKSWARVFDGDVRAVDVDPTDDDVIYLGTQPIHLYRSEDTGRTWEELTSLQALPEQVRARWGFPGRPTIDAGHVLQTVVHPENPNLVHVCLEHGGILRSFDRASSWEDVSGGIDYLDIHFLRNLPLRFDRYFVATARGFYTTEDPAKGWARAEQGFSRDYFHDFLFLPPKREGEHHTMVIATADKSPGHWPAAPRSNDGTWDPSQRGALAAVFRSEDYAQSWQRASAGLEEEINPMIWSLAANPVDPDGVLGGLGEVSRGHVTGGGGRGWVIASRDRGVSWETLDVHVPAVRKLLAQGD